MTQHRGDPKTCDACRIEAERTKHEFHPESDVGPWDAACPRCGHLRFCPPDKGCEPT